jgi:hypothetical protein
MLTTRNKPSLRRMKLEELIAKMQQIEEQASLTLHEYPHGHTKERVRLLLAIARQVRNHLTDQMNGGSREARRDGEVKVRVLDDREAANS